MFSRIAVAASASRPRFTSSPSLLWAASSNHIRSASQVSQATGSLLMPWKNTLGTRAPSFCQTYRTEFRKSAIEGAGKGWWASVDIPANTRLRRVSVEDGSLFRFENETELRATGWDIDEAVHYGIGHKTDPNVLYYLNPGTPCNHADPLREVSAMYTMEKPGEMELWSVRDIKAGRELLIDYTVDYVECAWYDQLCIERGLTPLSKLGKNINAMYDPVSKPWQNPSGTDSHSFSQGFATEFRASQIEGGGLGWWAKTNIPAGVMLRRVAVEDGSLHRFADIQELRETGWDIDEAVHYGIGHKADRGAIYYLNPGTPCNHADPTRAPSVEYRMEKPGEMELWSIAEVKATEELFIDYTRNFVECNWYDRLCVERSLTPLSKIGDEINAMYAE